MTTLVRDLFYNNSILFAANNEALAEAAEKNQNLKKFEKFTLGAEEAIFSLFQSTILGAGLSYALKNMEEGILATRLAPSPLESLLSAIVEEILLRGILQNGLAGIQKACSHSCRCLQNSKIFRWMISPSARIMAINSLFTVLHLNNAGNYLSTKNTLIQATCIMLVPTESILHETTGNMIAPLGSHITRNLFVSFFNKRS